MLHERSHVNIFSYFTAFVRAVASISVIAITASCSVGPKDFAQARLRMIDDQIRSRGILNEEVLRALNQIPRENFVLEKFKNNAYDDNEVPISGEDSLNRPFEDATMLDALKIGATDRVLEVGTGSGYFSALLSTIASHVFTIEIVPEMAEVARRNIAALGIENVTVRTGDGFLGIPDGAPYDAIVMQCSPPEVPPQLIDQLKEGGVLLLPLGGGEKFQELVLYRKTAGKLSLEKKLSPTNFTPMKGMILKK